MAPCGFVVAIEQFTPQTSRDGRKYVSFWLRMLVGDFLISTGGWKYFPDDGRLSTPSHSKGEARGFVNTAKVNPEFYNHIQQLAASMFGGRKEGEV